MRKKILCLTIFLVFLMASVHAISTDWFRNTLDAGRKNLYDRIGKAVLSCQTRLEDVDYDGEECLRIYSGYLDDHPGIFWAENSISYEKQTIRGRKTNNIIFKYTHQDNLSADQKRFVSLVDQFSENLKDTPNDWLKLYHIYSYLSKSIEYSTDYMDQTMWSVFFDGIGVCAGFARSFQYLALLEGIPSVVVHGWQKLPDGTKGERHLWVMAKIEDNWYHFDPTWGLMDASGIVDYTYFCRSRERMEMSHIIDERYPIPVADDDTLSYVNMRHRHMDRYSPEGFRNIVADALKRGERSFTVEFGNVSELEKAYTDIVTGKRFFTILKELNITDVLSYKHAENRECLSMKITLV